MGDQDYAIVVGIDTYFDSENFPKLKGPENDAREFYDWVTSSTGGAVPGKNALRVLSSEFRQPFQSLVDAKPTAKEIVAVFDAVFRVAGENAERGIGYKVGRRVYLFFAGHGFAPSHRQDQTALVVADADPSTSQLAHVLGTYMADALYHRYARRLTALARSRLISSLNSRVDAEDVTQSAFHGFFHQFGIFFERQPGSENTNYLVDHTAAVTVIDPEGYVRIIFTTGINSTITGADMASDIAYLMRRS